MRMTLRVHGDRGAVAVMFALMVTGVLGLGVLMVDVGMVYTEGRQLQNGAENAALAVAKSCASSTGCAEDAGDDLADANASDGRSDVELVCGTAPLPAGGCPTSGERARFGCGPVVDTAPYVQVQTRSQRADGAHIAPNAFIKVLDPGYTGQVRACARAAYGRPSGLTGELPLAMSECEFQYWKGLFGLVSTPYPSAAEAVLYFHATGDQGPSNCPARNTANNMDTPGGFGWLLTAAGTCAIATTVSGDAQVDPGNNTPCPADAFAGMWKQTVNVPVYSKIYKDPVTGKTMYDIVDYGAFYLSGYKLGGNSAYERASATLGGVPCGNPDRCISGFFTTETVPAAGPLLPGPGYGTTAIKVTG